MCLLVRKCCELSVGVLVPDFNLSAMLDGIDLRHLVIMSFAVELN